MGLCGPESRESKSKSCGQDYLVNSLLTLPSTDHAFFFFFLTSNIMHPPLKTSAAGKD